jgi:hypothetical protein
MRLSSVAVLAGVVLATSLTGTAAIAQQENLAATTSVGVHNTYAQDAYDYLAQALDSNSSLLELDVWPNVVTNEWKVSHDDPLGNANNCVEADSPDDLYTGDRDKNLEHCLDDIRVWLTANPDRGPIMLKIEMKPGFSNNHGMGPDELDTALRDHLGSTVFRPVDLLGGYANLDEAARADAWPSRDSLQGKVIVEIIPGSAEYDNPTDTLRTDVEYARHLLALAQSGQLDLAQIFPTVHRAEIGDPREQYDEVELRPWFVVFDGDASEYMNGIDTSWYDTNHYLLVMTDAHNVPPPIDPENPTIEEATERVTLLAGAHASVVSSDWAGLPDVLGLVLSRG